MKSTVYVESSVISYLTSRPSRDVIVAARQVITNDWWDNHRHRFELRVSVSVVEEIAAGDSSAAKLRMEKIVNIPTLSITDNAVQLAKLLLSDKAIPLGSDEDALHISIAATQSIDYLLTWNFKHINNAETKELIIKLIESCGYVSPRFCSPEELIGITHD
jgi:hypothetical protein